MNATVEWAGKLAGRDVIVLGNSPQVATLDLERVSATRAITMGLNAAPLLSKDRRFRLDYHLVFDWRFMAEKAQLVIPHLSQDTVCIWGENVAHAREMVRNAILWVPFLGYDGFSTNLAAGAFSGHTVAHLALQAAYFGRAARVFLAGVDLTYGARNTRFYQARRGADVELHVRNSQIANLVAGVRILERSGTQVLVLGDVSCLRGHVESASHEEALRLLASGPSA